ncbi:MAG TPA: MarR family winged helix-turn-helix transcriptional regulator [Smithella sp.]|nr:MarR family winged helix-turn-helix transcriptional regulator [Smithella sp.]HOG82724.1 MarR family winged helix-turn-helix transcriptional regulator [Smithellaceae bacterium]
MSKAVNKNATELIDVLSGLAQVMRSCCRDEAFCEGVTFHQFMILDAVAREKELHMADLHQFLAVEKSTTTRLVSPLIAKGLLKREAAIHDSRAAKLVLTGKGNEIHQKILACLAGFFQRVMGKMPARKRTAMLESVKLFISSMKKSANGGNGCC